MGPAALQVPGEDLPGHLCQHPAGASRSSRLASATAAAQSAGISPPSAPTIAPLIVAMESQSRP